MLGSAAFKATPQRRKLLEYSVEHSLAGRHDRLKAFELGVVVLGRNDRFDPQTDPIVRIEMGRLRRELEHYYQTAGHDDPIRIAIPRGNYIPVFALRDPLPPATAPSLARAKPGWARWRVPAAALAALCLLVLAGAAWRFAPFTSHDHPQAAGPAILVLPFEVLAGGEGGQLLANGLTGGLITDLMQFDGLRVFAGQASQSGIALPPAAAGALAYVISGSVEREPGRALVTARLTEQATGQVLWAQTYERPLTTVEIYDVRAELTAAIVGRLAQVYGVIAQAATRQLRQERPETLFAYDCVQQAFAYRRTSSMKTQPAAKACLEEAVRRDPSYAGAWAMLAFAHLDAARFGLVEPGARAGEIQAGLAAARRAVDLAPTSETALQSLAALQFGTGGYDEAERLQRQAIALNPQNPESLAQLGWRLVVRGKWQEGNILLQQAVDRSVAVPNWYRVTLAIGLYLGGKLEPARDAADAGKDFCCGVGNAVLAVTEAALGHIAVAHAAVDEALRQAPILAQDPAAFWLAFQVAPSVIEQLNAGLARAGLQAPTVPAAATPRS
ncbi:MAG TPA: hypothetical protein VM712_12305 [Gaiellales bacterium]|nr:hypothetical protein [Gaiellales bacterium]